MTPWYQEAVYVFNAANGAQLAKINNPEDPRRPENRDVNDGVGSATTCYGMHLDVSDTALVVGAYGCVPGAGPGAVFVYRAPFLSFTKITADHIEPGTSRRGDYFGYALATSETHFVVGAVGLTLMAL